MLSIQKAMEQSEGKVDIRGWVYRERGSKKLKFVVLRDSTNIIQCVFERGILGDEKFELIDKIQVEAALKISGEIKKDERAPSGFEISVSDFEVVGESHEFPIGKDQSREFLDDNRHLTLRTRRMSAILKIRSTIFGAIHEYFRGEGFYEFHSPILQAVSCEGGSTLFKVPYYD